MSSSRNPSPNPKPKQGDADPVAVVTGATGFLGRHLVRALKADGWTVIAAGRRPFPGTDVRFAQWSLGEPLPAEAVEADCVFHLACATTGASDPKAAAEHDFTGTSRIAEQLRAARASGASPVLVFISSQSASAQARNDYGRQKYRIEQMLGGSGEISVRPGLIVSTPAEGVYGTMRAGIRALPVLPDVGGRVAHQPVHVEDLCRALVEIARRALSGDDQRLWRIGQAEPVSFSGLVRGVARGGRIRQPWLVPFPGGLAARTLRALPPTRNLAERIDGIVALQPMETQADLERLGIDLRPLSEPSAERRHAAVRAARASLIALSPSRRADPVAWRRLARALYRSDMDLTRLPPPRWREPLGGFAARSLSDAAMRLYEATPEGQAERYRAAPSWRRFMSLCLLGLREAVIGPTRIAATLAARLSR